jgi:translocation and assembly module TamB
MVGPIDSSATAGAVRNRTGRFMTRLLKAVGWLVASILLALTLTLAGLWWWTGTDGSLATVLAWVSKRQPLMAEGVTGSLRAGGRVANLRWRQDGLDVQAREVVVVWQPLALLDRQLDLTQVAAAEIIIDDQRPPDPNRPAGPPDSLHLPLRVQISSFEVGRLGFTGPASVEVTRVSGGYGFDGFQHRLELKSAELAAGRYSGRATLSAASPLTLEAEINASLQADVPSGQTAVPLTIQATVNGPLTELLARAAIQAAPLAVPGDRAAGPQPQANANARIAPWAAQPVLDADADFRDLDVAAFYPDAPRTRLTGTASIRPVGSATSIASQAWALEVKADNALSGPWDRKRVPVDSVDGSGEWRNGVALVRDLKATIGRGQLIASGQWDQPAAGSSNTAQSAAPSWRAEARLKNINPALLYSELAPLPVSGDASARSDGPAIAFDVDLNAVAAGAQARAPKSEAAKPKTASARKPDAGGASDLLLALRQASAKGAWNAGRAGGTLTLSSLRIRTDDAELSGSVEVQPAAPGGKGTLALVAPGIESTIQGELRQASGSGDLSLRARDVTTALAWLKTLPGLPAAIQTASASGTVELITSWQGGWRDPALNARLNAPSLDWRVSSTTTPRQGAQAAVDADLLKLRALQATLSGRLSQAQFGAQGRLEMGTRRVDLQLAVNGGRSPLTGPGASIFNAPWQVSVSQLDVALEDAALGPGKWRLATRGTVPLKWAPATVGGGQFESGAGLAVLSAPQERVRTTPSPSASASGSALRPTPPRATIAWQPVRWRAGELVTAGKVTGLSMAWLELLAGPQLIDAGVSGNLLLEGQWDARLGDSVQLTASLGRVSGDLTMQAETAERTSARLPAGIREARVSLTSRGEALTLGVQWDSDRAGVADGRFETRLSRAQSGGAGGWTWAPDAPVSGRLRAQLPRIGVWSILAPPGWRLRGAVATDLTIGGTRSTPQLAGTLQADDLAMRSLADGIEFGNGALRARLDGTRMRIDEFTLQGAGEKGSGGLLTAKGEAGWINGRPEVRLDARLDKLRPSLRTDRQASVSGDVQASLIGPQTEITGKLRVDQARIILPEEATPQLGDDVIVRTARGAASGQKAPSQTSGSPASGLPEQGSSNRPVRLAILIDLGPDFQLEGKGIDTRLRGTLALSGESFSSPRLNGTISTVGGRYQAYGQRLDVERGVLRFTGAVDNPSLDVLAIRPNISQRVGLEILGTALLPRVRLYAQPELPDAEKLSWLIVGRASGSGGAEAALLQQAAIALLGSKTGGMSGGLAASLGLDELSFKGATSNADGGATQAAVTLGKRFSRNFYAAYERSISGALGTLFVFYDLSQRFTLRAQAGQQAAVDLIYSLPFD